MLTHDLETEINKRIKNNNPWTEPELMKHLAYVGDTLAHMQSRNYSHRDIKPQNLLVDDNGVLKIADFGNAREFAYGDLTIAGTPAYLSPQLKKGYLGYTYGTNSGVYAYNPYKADVYSLGLTFLYMATMRTILDCDTADKAINRASELPFPYLRRYLVYMLQEFEESRPDFLKLRDFFIEGNYLRNLDQIIKENYDLFKNSPIALNSTNLNNFTYKVLVHKEMLKTTTLACLNQVHNNLADQNLKANAELLMIATNNYNNI